MQRRLGQAALPQISHAVAARCQPAGAVVIRRLDWAGHPRWRPRTPCRGSRLAGSSARLSPGHRRVASGDSASHGSHGELRGFFWPSLEVTGCDVTAAALDTLQAGVTEASWGSRAGAWPPPLDGGVARPHGRGASGVGDVFTATVDKCHPPRSENKAIFPPFIESLVPSTRTQHLSDK